MDFTVDFYVTMAKQSPVLDFLEGLKASDSGDFAAVMAGLAKLRNRGYHRLPLSKDIGDDLYELRHIGKLNTRVLYFFMRGRRIIAVHGIRNKGQKILSHDRQTALARMNDWLKRQTT